MVREGRAERWVPGARFVREGREGVTGGQEWLESLGDQGPGLNGQGASHRQ